MQMVFDQIVKNMSTAMFKKLSLISYASMHYYNNIRLIVCTSH